MSIRLPYRARNRRSRPRWPGVVPRRPHFLLRRKVLFTLAGAILLACAISSPLSLLFLLCSDRLVALVIAGFLVAATVRILAPVCFAAKGGAWHTRWAAPIFLFVALVGVNIAFHAADRLAFAVLGTGPFLASAVAAHVLITLELIWIVLLR